MKGHDLTKGHDHSSNMTGQCVYIYIVMEVIVIYLIDLLFIN